MGGWDTSTKSLLMEVGQVLHQPFNTFHGPGGTYCVQVRCQQGIWGMELGCTQTLVQPGPLVEAEQVEVRCVHGDIHKYPIVPLQINTRAKHSKGCSSRLKHLLIPGTDWD